jgi:hypothetical protein
MFDFLIKRDRESIWHDSKHEGVKAGEIKNSNLIGFQFILRGERK